MAAQKLLHDQSKVSSIGSSVESGVERGRIETWPVKPSGRVNGSITQQGSSLITQIIIPKPKFLQQLESYLEKELRLLGCPPKGPHALRLQAHREVFEMLIQDFKTYKPLLSTIKNEYDQYVLYQEEAIKELLPFKTELHFVHEENEKNLLELKSKEKKEDEKLRQECRQLKDMMFKMNNDHLSFKAQIDKLQEELGITYEKYRDEADARKLLVSDIIELKNAKLEEQRDAAGGDTKIEHEDPVMLKLKLTRAKEDLKNANIRINQMLADYGDVVPRREFEMLQTSYTTIENETESLRTQYATLIEEHKTLLVMHKDLQTQRDKSVKELRRMKGTATPRPDWSRCGDFIDGGPDKWAEISEGRSSNELVDVLCAQIAGIDVNELTHHGAFKGQGLSTNVPRYLRCEEQVINRRMGRKEMEELITGFWEYHSMKTVEGQDQIQSLDVQLYDYLMNRNDGKEDKTIEDGYNFNDCCSRYLHLSHVEVFTSIMSGIAEDEVFNGWISTQVVLVEKLKTSMGPEDTLSLALFEEGIRQIFSYKEESCIKSLLQCAIKTAREKDGVNIIKLMDKGPNSEPSDFVLMLLEQRRDETKQYASDISKLLGQKDLVSVEEVSKALKNYDIHKHDPEIHLLICKLFQVPLGQQLDESESASRVPMKDIIRRLEATNITKSSAA